MMKQILKIMIAAALLLGTSSCDNTTEEQPVPEIEVTTNNISGTWKLSLWNNQPLPEGSFIYIDFVRSSSTYTMYQNIDSFGTRTLTGRFTLYVDEEIGAAVLRGDYDHGAGEWNHRYIVESLTATTMLLVAKDNAVDRCLYERSDIPAEIIGE